MRPMRRSSRCLRRIRMEIKREVLHKATNLDEVAKLLKEEAETRNMGEARDRNDFGPVYISAQYDLRIERDPGQWGEYRLMLLHKVQPATSMADKLKGKLRRG